MRIDDAPLETRSACVRCFCSGCAVGPKYQRPVAQTPPALKEIAGNDQWKMATPSDGVMKGKWWELFGDPQLNQLEELININNQNVKQAEAQFRQARAMVVRQSRQLLSDHRIELRPSRKPTPGELGGGLGGTSQTFSLPFRDVGARSVGTRAALGGERRRTTRR